MIRGGVVTLDVRDPAEAVRFYVETLGMKLVEERAGIVVLDAGDGFHLGLRAGTTRSSAVTFYAKVPLAEAVAIYENRGVSFAWEEADGRKVARFRDPDGNELRIA